MRGRPIRVGRVSLGERRAGRRPPVPGHAREKHPHPAGVRHAGEDQPGADEAGEPEEAGVDEEAERPRLIVVQAGTLELAIMADDVLEMTGIPLTEIVPPVTAGIGLDHVQGISTSGIVIVDVASLATDPQLFVHDEA